ncbi:hypothetical protein H4219_002424 [Mycoemilia scoparia]|uniref:WKF domain-containing protein n=1 Tax=Mycoemilia scoparia TaxID=417184 RepID=A0A9W8A411_9FUNG|nr:hypothetical protein H4219_002424 [Mycoemilia scoparia]
MGAPKAKQAPKKGKSTKNTDKSDKSNKYDKNVNKKRAAEDTKDHKNGGEDGSATKKQKKEKKPVYYQIKRNTSSERKKARLAKARVEREEAIKRSEALAVEVIDYLKQWKNNHDEWKFQKSKQIWIVKNVYKPAFIKDEDLPLVLEYMKTMKGGVCGRVAQEAQKLIEKLEKQASAEDKEAEGKTDDKPEKEEDDDDDEPKETTTTTTTPEIRKAMLERAKEVFEIFSGDLSSSSS